MSEWCPTCRSQIRDTKYCDGSSPCELCTDPWHTAPAETAEQRPLPPEFYAPVSAERARESAKRYRNLQFKLGGERPRACIPANPDDDDLVIGRFIEQHVRLEREHQVMREALESLLAVYQREHVGIGSHNPSCCLCRAESALSQIGKP